MKFSFTRVLVSIPARESFRKAGRESSGETGAGLEALGACVSVANVDVFTEDGPLDSTSIDGEAELSLSLIMIFWPVPVPGRRSACNCVRADCLRLEARFLIAWVGIARRASL